MQDTNRKCERLLRRAGAFRKVGNLAQAENFYTEAGELACREGFLEGILRAGSGLNNIDCQEKAGKLYRKGLEKFPDDYALHCRIGSILTELYQSPAAIGHFEKALELRPGDPEVLFNSGLAFQANGHMEKARELFEKALEKGADKGLVLGSLATIYEQTNRLEQLEDLLEKARAESPDDVMVLFNSAKFARRRGDYEEALDLLKRAEAQKDFEDVRMVTAFERGRIFEKMEEFDRAFQYFEKGNQLSLEQNIPEKISKENALDQIKNYKGKNYHNWLRDAADPLSSNRETPAFLVGFPRSGTTLLHQILNGHSKIAVLEEEPLLEMAKQSLYEKFGSFSTALEHMNKNLWTLFRDELLAAYKERITKSGKDLQLIDKLPLNIIEVPLILKIFPQAKFIVVLRHPLDCTLSCFMQNFELNNAMLNFTNLADTTNYYSEVFLLWQKYEQELEFKKIYVRYEDLIAEVKKETAKILDFLELPWEEEVLNYQQKALEQERIKTPSYHQVIQPIYTESKNRWKKFEKYLEPYKNRLAPFCKTFGYDL